MEAIKIDKFSEGENVTVDSFVEESTVPGKNLLENELYSQDNNVQATLDGTELNVSYKGYQFLINGDLSISSMDIVVTPRITNSTMTSLTITSDITGLDDLSQITARYYSCDNGVTWRNGQNLSEYVCNGLIANSEYNVKVKLKIGSREVISSTLKANTLSTASNIAAINELDSNNSATKGDFFITEDNGATIAGINSEYTPSNTLQYTGFDGTLVIPTTYKGVNITKIKGGTGSTDGAFRGIQGIQKIYIEEGITTIGEQAFLGCSNLREIVFPTTIETLAKVWASYVTKITIPQKMIDGNYRVEGIIGSTGASNIEEISFNGTVTQIGSQGLSNCTNLKYINFPNTLTSFGDYSLYHCEKLEKINLPESLTSIGDHVFDGCSKLSRIEIPESVNEIGECAFVLCTSLTEAIIKSTSQTKTVIKASAFSGCSALTNVELGEGIDKIKEYVFGGCSALTELTIPTSVSELTNISTGGATKITIPQKVLDIGIENAFSVSSAEKITEIHFNEPITVFKGFAWLSALTRVDIPAGVTSIGNVAFYQCTNLEEVTIPESVTSIASDAFQGCSKLTQITIDKTEDSITGKNWGAPNSNLTITWTQQE